MNVEIRVVTNGDEAWQDAVQKINKAVWPDADREHFGEGLPPGYFDKGDRLLLACAEGEVVGYLKFDFEMGVAHIKTTAVLAAYRRQGVAKALKLRMEEMARNCGCHKIMTETGVGWDSEKMNRSLGYTVVTILENHFGGKDFYLFHKFLT
jgi:ribosomal protein S18 acetylase RimI-like enzyme